MTRFLFSTLYLLILAMNGCGKLPGFRVGAKTDSFEQAGNINSKIDMLFVIDNSGSMSDKQTALANSFATFMSEFVTRNLDFHIAVISTDTTSAGTYWSSSSGVYANFVNNGPGTFLAYRNPSTHVVNSRILTSSSSNLIDQFKQNVKIGSNGNGAEAGLLSITTALQPSLLNSGGWNANFIRDDALLSIILITDEDESDSDAIYSRDRAGHATTRLSNLSAALTALKPNHPELIRFDTVASVYDGSTYRAAINTDSTYSFDPYYYFGPACSTSFASASSVGYTVGQAATQNNGSVISVCSDFGSTIAQLGATILSVLTKFTLKQRPVDNALQVTVNGIVIANNATNGWTFDSNTLEVTFHGTSVPKAGDSVGVAYIPSAPIN